jgi:hypothetical protein
MVTPTVTEVPRRLEPTTTDPFIRRPERSPDMTNDLGRHLTHELTEDRLALARQRQLAGTHSRTHRGEASRRVIYTRRRRWMRRLRRVLLPA